MIGKLGNEKTVAVSFSNFRGAGFELRLRFIG
jgi:hypothetical protein